VKSSEKTNILRLAKNSLIAGAGNILGIVVVPITSVITTRVLGSELFGIYSLVQSWGALLANLSSFGLNGANLRFKPTYQGLGDTAKMKGSIYWTLQVSLLISVCITVSIFLFPTQFCNVFIHRPEQISEAVFQENVVAAFRFYSISISLTAIYLGFLSSLNGMQAIKYKVVSNDIMGSIAKVSTLILLVLAGYDLYAALLSNLIQDVTILVFSGFFLIKVFPACVNREMRPRYERKQLNRFSVFLFSNSLLSKYTFQLDILFLGNFAPLKEVGIYTVALRLQPLIYLPIYSIMALFSPMTAELFARKDIAGIAHLYKNVTKWTVTFSLPIAATIVLFAQDILNIFGRDFSSGVAIVLILSIGNVIHDFLGIAGQIITMTGRIKINLINSVIMSCVNLGLFYFLIREYGIMGAAFGNALSNVIINVIMLVEVIYLYGIHPFKKTLYKPFVAVMTSVALTIVMTRILPATPHSLWFLGHGFFLVSSYALMLLVLGFDEEDRFVLSRMMGRLKRFFKRKV